jgi:hypothetical protein
MGKVPAMPALVLGLCVSIASPFLSYGASSKVSAVDSATQEWQVYGGQAEGDHYCGC